MKTYLRCVYANKFTLAGYLLILYACFTGTYLLKNKTDFPVLIIMTAGLSLYCGIISLTLTSFGMETLKAYLRSIKHLKKGGGIADDRFESRYIDYCNKCGMRMAKHDFIKLQKPR